MQMGVGAPWENQFVHFTTVRYPQIKAFSWFKWYFDQSGTWRNYEIESSATAQTAFKTGIASPYYRAGGGLGGLPLHTKVAPLP